MEAQDGVYIEDKNCITENIVSEKLTVEELTLDVIDTNDEKLSEAKVVPTGVAMSDDLKRSKTKFDGSKPSKESGAIAEDYPKTKNVMKEKHVVKGTTSSVRNQKTNLSQSSSFKSKGSLGSTAKKSLDSSSVKSILKQSQGNGEVTLKEISVKRAESSSKQISVLSAMSIKGSVSAAFSVKNANASANCPASDSSLVLDDCMKSIKEVLPEDSDETKSPNQNQNGSASRKSATSVFSFRLDERAGKRKEFNMKIEERINAKEAEKNNLQAKSKENQEAEIKQLRKSLNFKATPMPSFYREPPPKVELKKIPTTRAVSPKLGRNKSSVGATNTTSEASSVSAGMSSLQKMVHVNGEKTASNSHKPVKKSQFKSQPQESLGLRSGDKTAVPKIKKLKEVETDTATATTEEKEETISFAQNFVEGVESSDKVPSMEISQDNEATENTLNNGAIAGEIMVGG